MKAAREAAGLTQARAAELLGVDKQTVSRWERDEHSIPSDMLAKASTAYNAIIEVGETVPRGTRDGGWSPSPALAKAFPARVYEVAIGYCRRLERAGMGEDVLDEAERLLIDVKYVQMNRRLGRPLSEDDLIMLVDRTWDVISESLSWKGVRV